jgi:hypothetical protein
MPRIRRARAVDAFAREVDDLLEIVRRLQGKILQKHTDVSEALIPAARKLAQVRDLLIDLAAEVRKDASDR